MDKKDNLVFNKRIKQFFRAIDPLRVLKKIIDHFTILLARIRRTPRYQTIYGTSSRSRRDCTLRWEMMKKHLPRGGFSFLDIGSEIGYFTFKASELGGVSIGVEMSKRKFDLANTIRSINNMGKTTFLNMEVNEDTVTSLPNVNVLCCLSIYHYWVRMYGFEGADKIFTKLCEKTNAIFFETGQPDQGPKLASLLSFMGPDIKKWITDYLISKGFKRVECIGRIPKTEKASRLLFFASKQ